MTNDNRMNGFLQAGNMAIFLDISKGTLASWRKEGKIQESSWIEPSDGLFLYEIKSVLADLRMSELIRSASEGLPTQSDPTPTKRDPRVFHGKTLRLPLTSQ